MWCSLQHQQLDAARREPQVPFVPVHVKTFSGAHSVLHPVAAASKRPASHAAPPPAAEDPAKKSRVRAQFISSPPPLHQHHQRCAQVDALFADLLADDPPLRPRPVGGIITSAFASGAAATGAKASAPTASISSSVVARASSATLLQPSALSSAMTGVGHKEVTITTTKDFAGQMVNVTRTVAVGSEEHKKLMQVTASSSFCSSFVVQFFLFFSVSFWSCCATSET
jgi:hypothetical protein